MISIYLCSEDIIIIMVGCLRGSLMTGSYQLSRLKRRDIITQPLTSFVYFFMFICTTVALSVFFSSSPSSRSHRYHKPDGYNRDRTLCGKHTCFFFPSLPSVLQIGISIKSHGCRSMDADAASTSGWTTRVKARTITLSVDTYSLLFSCRINRVVEALHSHQPSRAEVLPWSLCPTRYHADECTTIHFRHYSNSRVEGFKAKHHFVPVKLQYDLSTARKDRLFTRDLYARTSGDLAGELQFVMRRIT